MPFSLKQFLPYESQFITIGPHRMHFYDEGSKNAPAVLLLHGNPTWSFYYRDLIRLLKPHCRVIAVDHIGCGLSDHPSNAHFRASERADHLERLVDHLGLNSFSLVMHDWGGPLGTSLAIRRPHAIQRLLYLNTTLTETESLPSFIKLAATPLIGKFLTKTTAQFLRLATEFGVVQPLSAEVKEGYHFPYPSKVSRTAIWDFVADIPFSSSHPSYSEQLRMADGLPQLSNKPVMIVWGLKDPCFHREMLSKVARHFPQAKVIELREASHLVLEDCSPEVKAEMVDFLQGKSSVVEIPVEHTGQPGPALFEAFVVQAGERPQADAVVTPSRERAWNVNSSNKSSSSYKHTNFQALYDRINQYQRGLIELGLRAGDKVIMLVEPGIDFLALSYAVMGRGAIPIFLDPGMGLENLCRCIADAAPDAFIGTPKAHALRLLKPSVFKTIRFAVAASDWFPGRTANLSRLKSFASAPLPTVHVQEDAPGLIAFTSGATGTPKGVIFTHKMLRTQLSIFENVLGLHKGAKDMPLLPIFSLFTIALGVGSVMPPLDPSKPLELDPEEVCRIINDQNVRYSFGSPTLWNKISEYAVRHETKLSTLNRIFLAGASVPTTVIERLQIISPNASIFTPYGATEALPVTLLDGTNRDPIASSDGQIGTPVGKSVPGVEVRVMKDVDGAISSIDQCTSCAPLEIGEVIVKGNNVSPAYLNRPDANKFAKIKDGEAFWHRMGDMGYLDKEGRLFYCGRKSHVVRVNGRAYFSDPVEFIFNKHPKIRRSALVGLFGGKEPAIVVEPFPEYWPKDDSHRKQLVTELQQLASNNTLTKEIQKFYFHPSFPVDARHNAKIFRDKLGVWASGKEIH